MFWEYGDKVCRSIEYTAVIRENEHAFPRHTETNPISPQLPVLGRKPSDGFGTEPCLSPHLEHKQTSQDSGSDTFPANVCESVNLEVKWDKSNIYGTECAGWVCVLSLCTWHPEQVVSNAAGVAGQRAVKGLDEHPFVPLGTVTLHRGQHLPQLIPASHCVQVLPQSSQDKVFPTCLHGGNLSPTVAPGVISTGGPYCTCPPSGVLHLSTYDKQEVPHYSHTVVAASSRHGDQFAPVRPARHSHVLLHSRVEISQLPDSAHLPLPTSNYVEGEGLEAGSGPGWLVEGLSEDGAVVVQGLIYQSCSGGARLDQRMATRKVVQCGDVHQAVADVLQKVLGVLVATVVLEPQNNQLNPERREDQLETKSKQEEQWLQYSSCCHGSINSKTAHSILMYYWWNYYLNSVWLSFCFFSSFKLETKVSLLQSFFIQSLQKANRKDVRIRGKCRRKESVGKTLGKNRDRERKPMWGEKKKHWRTANQ